MLDVPLDATAPLTILLSSSHYDFLIPTMPNKYSHALVLSQYEACGMIDWHNHSQRPPPATIPVSADRTQPQCRPNPPPVTRAPPTPSPAAMEPMPTITSAPPSFVFSKITPPATSAPPRAVFEDSPPSTPEPLHIHRGYRHAPPISRGSRRWSLDQSAPPPTTKNPSASASDYRHIPSATPIPPQSTVDYKDDTPAATAFLCSTSALKELPRDIRTQPPPSRDSVDARSHAAAPSNASSGLKQLPRHIQPPPSLSLDSNYARSTAASSSAPRPRTAGATPATTSQAPSHPRILTFAPSFQSSHSSHHTTDSVTTQIYAPEAMSPPPTLPRPSASFETAIFVPEPASPPKVGLRREPPAIPPRSSSIPRRRSSSIHHPDFDAFSSANSPTMSSPNSTFTSTSSFHQTPRTSYSRVTSSLLAKSPERRPGFNPDQVPAPDPETALFSGGFADNAWETPDESEAFFRPSMSSKRYSAEGPSRGSSSDEAAPPPISRAPRARNLPFTATTKKARRLSFTLFRPDCEGIRYDQTAPGSAPIPITTVKALKNQESSGAVGESEYTKRTSCSLVRRKTGVRDPFEDRRRGRGFTRAGGV